MIDVNNLPPVRKGDIVTLDTDARYESNGNGQIQYAWRDIPCDRDGVLLWAKDMPRQLSLFGASA
jgi:hypothetical protein